MDDRSLLKHIDSAKQNFGTTCSKYSGAITVEFIRLGLLEHGISVSPREVYIKGVPIEIDLLVPRAGAIPEHRLLYHPEDVLVVFEIKNHGTFGEKTVEGIRNNFATIHKYNEKIHCWYVTLLERKGYKWAITKDTLGFSSYTLFWHSGSGKNYKVEPTGDWARLITDLHSACQRTDAT